MTVTKSYAQLPSRGYSIIELSIALGIMAVIIVGSLVGVQRILRSNAVNNELKAAPVTLTAGTRITSTSATLAGVNTASMVAMGVWAQDRVSGTAAAPVVNNQFGGQQFMNTNAVAVGAYQAGQVFVLTYTGVPQEACAEMVAGLDALGIGLWVAADIAADPAGVIAGTNVKNPGAVGTAPARSVNFANVATGCGNTGGARVTIHLAALRN